MTAIQLFQLGDLKGAIQALGALLRDNPDDAKSRTFLFELLCFAGEYDRAEKHLAILAGASNDAEIGAAFYQGALHAERERKTLFENGAFPEESVPRPSGGTLNGAPFQSLEDADERLGAQLEIFASGIYLWIPFAHISSIEMEAPKKLRDTLWATALVRTTPGFKGDALGEVLLPAVNPLSFRSTDGSLVLGRASDWVETPDGRQIPVGQKMLIVDGDVFPFLEIRKLEFAPE
jgi:type VI secretion system protein ImpE